MKSTDLERYRKALLLWRLAQEKNDTLICKPTHASFGLVAGEWGVMAIEKQVKLDFHNQLISRRDAAHKRTAPTTP